MLDCMSSVWFWFGSDRPGFCLGTSLLITLMLLMYAGSIQASLSVGPGGDFPRFTDVFLYALSHDELPSLLVSVALLLLFGPCQERRWGTVALLLLSILTVTQRRLLRCLPVWFLPWLLLLIGLLLLPGTPALLHFCAICIGHNYRQPFIGMLQELEEASVLDFIPDWMYVSTSARLRLPTYATSHRSRPISQTMPVDQSAAVPVNQPSVSNHHSWIEPLPAWIMEESTAIAEAEVLEEEMLRAGILASLQDAPDEPDPKVEVPKSSVSSLRLQQLQKMGFPTEKAVVALAASKQLDGAISLLIEDNIGEQAVVVSKGKSPLPPQNT
ncbi:rhomboid domain-containing protein 3 isoform X2 [Archocentrus centrarchus]|uniref:rhomboid domain-containing protein 3 isoform X2 n=1 Tax=Archocentrus centrarchus TaxID=63155 RepID=UPI0011E9F2F4|nr:rhomboid domain-containing protein 3 isoform X2 [Archocentrus centrarchus]